MRKRKSTKRLPISKRRGRRRTAKVFPTGGRIL